MQAIAELFRKHRRLIIFLSILLALFWLLYALRSAVVPFVFGWVLAQLVMPLILWVEKTLPGEEKWQQTKRISLIVLIFLVFLALVAFLSFIVITAVVGAFAELIDYAPQYIAGSALGLQQWAEDLLQQFPPEMRAQVQQLLIDGAMAAGRAIRDAFLRAASSVPTTFGMMFGFAALPLFLFYLLKDWEKLGKSFYGTLPVWLAVHTRSIISIIDGVLVRYIRAQLLLGSIVAYFAFIGLLFLVGIRYAPALAAFAGVTELVPTIGPWIGGAAAVIVALAIAPQQAVWVALLFLVIQLLENNLLVPRIQGAYLRVHPALAIVLLVLGAYIAGFWGLLLAIPLTATVTEIYKYVRASAGAVEVTQGAE